MKKLIYIFLGLVVFFFVSLQQEWIVVTPKGKKAFTQAKDYTFKVGGEIKEKIITFYNDVRGN